MPAAEITGFCFLAGVDAVPFVFAHLAFTAAAIFARVAALMVRCLDLGVGLAGARLAGAGACAFAAGTEPPSTLVISARRDSTAAFSLCSSTRRLTNRVSESDVFMRREDTEDIPYGKTQYGEDRTGRRSPW